MAFRRGILSGGVVRRDFAQGEFVCFSVAIHRSVHSSVINSLIVGREARYSVSQCSQSKLLCKFLIYNRA